MKRNSTDGNETLEKKLYDALLQADRRANIVSARAQNDGGGTHDRLSIPDADHLKCYVRGFFWMIASIGTLVMALMLVVVASTGESTHLTTQASGICAAVFSLAAIPQVLGARNELKKVGVDI